MLEYNLFGIPYVGAGMQQFQIKFSFMKMKFP